MFVTLSSCLLSSYKYKHTTTAIKGGAKCAALRTSMSPAAEGINFSSSEKSDFRK